MPNNGWMCIKLNPTACGPRVHVQTVFSHAIRAAKRNPIGARNSQLRHSQRGKADCVCNSSLPEKAIPRFVSVDASGGIANRTLSGGVFLYGVVAVVVIMVGILKMLCTMHVVRDVPCNFRFNVCLSETPFSAFARHPTS